MGRRGPPPKPTELRKRQGNPGKLPINKNEPKPRPSVPVCPDWLDDVAKERWRDLIPDLKAMKIISRVDRDMLAAYCNAYSMVKEASEFIQEHGTTFAMRGEPTFENPKGPIRCMLQFPQVSIHRNYIKIMQQLGAELGLTPAGRTRLNAALPLDPHEEEEETSQFLTILKGGKSE